MSGVDDRAVSRPALVLLAVLVALTARVAATSVELRELPVGDFDRVHFTGSGTVHLTQADTARVTVRGPGGVERLRVDVRDGALLIETREDAGDLVIDLQVARLTEFVSEGDGHITGDGLRFDAVALIGSGGGSFDLQRLEARRLAVRGRGATRFDLSGQVDDQVVDLAGTGAYRAGELLSDFVRIDVAGASEVQLWADRQLDLRVAGAASVRYAGAAQVRKQVSGVAHVERLPGIVI